jgi:thiamine phosphate synthase YjbQ (UPF0047 family)
MKIVDIKSRNETQFAGIQRKVKAFVKTVGCNTGRISFSNEGALYFIEVDNDGGLATELASFVKDSPNGVVLEKKDYAGVYDWTSDTYIRPCSIVTFKFT